jgi:hypothetical protein
MMLRTGLPHRARTAPDSAAQGICQPEFAAFRQSVILSPNDEARFEDRYTALRAGSAEQQLDLGIGSLNMAERILPDFRQTRNPALLRELADLLIKAIDTSPREREHFIWGACVARHLATTLETPRR